MLYCNSKDSGSGVSVTVPGAAAVLSEGLRAETQGEHSNISMQMKLRLEVTHKGWIEQYLTLAPFLLLRLLLFSCADG